MGEWENSFVRCQKIFCSKDQIHSLAEKRTRDLEYKYLRGDLGQWVQTIYLCMM